MTTQRTIQGNTRIYKFNELSDLRALSGQWLNEGDMAVFTGTQGSDGTERIYLWNTASTITDDSDMTVKLTDTTTGRFRAMTDRNVVLPTNDGTTDDRARLQAAIDANPTVRLVDGTYVIGDSGSDITYRTTNNVNYGVNLPSNCVIEGCGFNTVIKVADSSDSVPFVADSKTRITLRNIRIDGNALNQSSNLAFGVYFLNCSEIVLDNVWIHDTQSNTHEFIGCSKIIATKLYAYTETTVSGSIGGGPQVEDCTDVQMQVMGDTYDDLCSVISNMGDSQDMDYDILGTSGTRALFIGQSNAATTNVQGTHDGGAAQATLTDSTASWATDEHVGKILLNITNGTQGTVTANTATTITASLVARSITAFADAGGGQVTVTSANHKIGENQSVTITGTTNYNGTFTATNVTTNDFEITDTWVSDDATGSVTGVFSWDDGDQYGFNHHIRNISARVNSYGCGKVGVTGAFTITRGGIFDNINLQMVDRGSYLTARMTAHDATFVGGVMRNCHFDISSSHALTHAVEIRHNDHADFVSEHNSLRLKSRHHNQWKRGPAWAPFVDHVVGDTVTESGSDYFCAVPHTSGTFATDLAAQYWFVQTPWEALQMEGGDHWDFHVDIAIEAGHVDGEPRGVQFGTTSGTEMKVTNTRLSGVVDGGDPPIELVRSDRVNLDGLVTVNSTETDSVCINLENANVVDTHLGSIVRDGEIGDDGTGTRRAPITLHRGVSTATTSGTGEDDLGSYTLPGRFMGKTGVLKIRASGEITGTNDTKTIRFKHGSAAIVLDTVAAGTTGEWVAEVDVYQHTNRVSQKFVSRMWVNGALASSAYDGTPSTDTRSDSTMKFTGQCANAGDAVTQETFFVEGF